MSKLLWVFAGLCFFACVLTAYGADTAAFKVTAIYCSLSAWYVQVYFTDTGERVEFKFTEARDNVSAVAPRLRPTEQQIRERVTEYLRNKRLGGGE